MGIQLLDLLMLHRNFTRRQRLDHTVFVEDTYAAQAPYRSGVFMRKTRLNLDIR